LSFAVTEPGRVLEEALELHGVDGRPSGGESGCCETTISSSDWCPRGAAVRARGRARRQCLLVEEIGHDRLTCKRRSRNDERPLPPIRTPIAANCSSPRTSARSTPRCKIAARRDARFVGTRCSHLVHDRSGSERERDVERFSAGP
jgi:hypothetical protein